MKVRRRIWVRAAGLAAMSVMLACQPKTRTAVDEKAAAERAVREADVARAQALATADIDQYLTFFTEDATLSMEGRSVAGSGSLRRWVSGSLIGPWVSERRIAGVVVASRAGDLAYTVGSYRRAYRGPIGPVDVYSGRYLSVWQRQADGAWKVKIESLNSDRLPPPPGTW